MRIGIDLGGTKIEGLLLTPDGSEVSRRRVPTPRDDYAATVRAIVDLVSQLEAGLPQPARVGVGTPGAVSPASGRMRNCNSTWLNGRSLREDLEAALARPLRLANDADCFALSEAVDGAGADAATVLGVILGTGVGGGIVVHGRPLSGPNAVAGEWGHNPLPWPTPDEWPGPSCYCGLTGCIESLLSGPALEGQYYQIAGRRLTATEIEAEAQRGDAAALDCLNRYQDRLARALAGVINILDPQVIVLGGGVSNLSTLYTAVPLLWGAYVFADRVDTPLVPPQHGDSGGVRGAAWLWESD